MKFKINQLIETVSETKNMDGQSQIIFLNTGDIIGGEILSKNFENVNQLPGQAKKSIKNGDILYSEIRPKNKRYALIQNINEDEFVVSTKLMVLRNIRKDILMTKYFYYWLTSERITDYLQEQAESRSGTFPQITFKDVLGVIELEVPSIQRQENIVKLMDSVNGKIATNQKINDNLVELAMGKISNYLKTNKVKKQRIGDLDLTVSDHVANGSFKALKDNVTITEKPDFALFLRNVDLKKDMNGEKRYVSEGAYKFLTKSRLFGHEVVISNVADVGSVHRVPKLNVPMVAGNNIIFLQSTNEALTDWLYWYFSSTYGQQQIESITSGSAQQKFNKTDFRNLYVPIVDEQFINNVLSPFLTMMDYNKQEISLLMKLRDTLLPKLLNGEVELSN